MKDKIFEVLNGPVGAPFALEYGLSPAGMLARFVPYGIAYHVLRQKKNSRRQIIDNLHGQVDLFVYSLN
jgi:hypothetical protein